MRANLIVLGLASLAVLAGACSAPGGDDASSDESKLSEPTTPRDGGSISSPSVDPSKRYWGARSIKVLQQVGYLSDKEAGVARRADGIIANNYPNGLIGVDELAMLESPAHVNTLFPEERAVIPKLWAILVINDAPAFSPSAVAIPMIVHDAYPHGHYEMPIASLVASQDLAKRIELTNDDDSDPTTISAVDLQKAFADKGLYLPEEIALLNGMHRAIAQAAPQLGADAQYVEVPASSRSVLTTSGAVELAADLVYAVNGAWTPRNPKDLPTLVGTAMFDLKSSDAETRIVTLDKVTASERLRAIDATDTGVADNQRVEIWKGGARVAELDTGTAQRVTTAIPFGYGVKIGSQTFVLNCNSVGSLNCPYVPPPTSSQADFYSRSAVPPTSYYVEGHLDYRFDLFANGRGLLVGPSGTSICYPSSIGAFPPVIQGCTFFGPDGSSLGEMSFQYDSADDAPVFASGSVTTPALAHVPLYVQ